MTDAEETINAALDGFGVRLNTDVAITLRHGGKVTGRVVDARVRAQPTPFGPPTNVDLVTVTLHRTGAGIASDRARAVVPFHAIDLVEPTGSAPHPALGDLA